MSAPVAALTGQVVAPRPGVPRPSWRILGPLEGTAAGSPIHPGPPLRAALLAVLVAHDGSPVSMSALVESLWGDSPPERATNVVHKHIGALRRKADPTLARRATGTWLLSGPSGYYIDTEAALLDVSEFRALAAEGRSDLPASERLRSLLAALAVWRGPAGEGLGLEHRSRPVFERLDREHAAAAALAAELAIALGSATEVLSPLRLAARTHPTDELVHSQLVLALASTGRRTEALETYSAVRARLVEEVGVEPSAPLRDAQLAVLRDELPVGPRPAAPVPAQLPLAAPAFAAREVEVDRLAASLREGATGLGHSPVVSVVGPPGVGKTALALHVAQRSAADFPDGQLFVDLHGYDPTHAPRSADDVLGHFLDSLGVSPSQVPDGLDRRSATLRSILSRRRVLIVLDNAVSADQVRPLLPGGGTSRAVVTSRAALRSLVADGVGVLSLAHLDRADSRRVLAARLGDDRVAREPEATQELVRMTGGLPLALALVAAQAAVEPSLPLAAMVEEMRNAGRGLDVFSEPADTRTDIRAVLSWSYARLSADASRLFRLLSRHPGATIHGPSSAQLADISVHRASALLVEVCEASLISRDVTGHFVMHDLIRAYATELSDAEDGSERSAAEGRLYSWAGATSLAAAVVMTPERSALHESSAAGAVGNFDSPTTARSWLETHRSLLIELITRPMAPPEHDQAVWRMAWSLQHLLDQRGHWDELVRTQTAALKAATRSAPPLVRASIHRGLGRALANVGRSEEARVHMQHALELATHDSTPLDPEFLAETHRLLSWMHERAGRMDEALAAARDALGSLPPDSSAPSRAFALNAVGWYEALAGRHDAAAEHCLQALKLLEGTAHHFGRADALASLGYVRFRQGRLGEAARHYRRSQAILHRLGAKFAEGHGALELGHVLLAMGDQNGAREAWEQAQALFSELDHEQGFEAAALIAGLPAPPRRHPPRR